MKRIIYIVGFVFLGILLSTLLHAGIELVALDLIISDDGNAIRYLSWDQWKLIHLIGGLTLWLIGIVLGYQQGKYWWEYIYVQKNRSVQK